eukprot:CAMPEP_0181472060 /NCGR_PEP_ID=MMETSP1110-20121109/39400_1 /TAXON_ID=174948 /ORGANISM="Symbiodinium sp., Strain CCMP421" /LENGTH=38 /DNA_ID= /DNA_START= /DNA_END= /DNA_ORIENTATION=
MTQKEELTDDLAMRVRRSTLCEASDARVLTGVPAGIRQ